MKAAKSANKLFLIVMIFYLSSAFLIGFLMGNRSMPLNLELVLSEILILVPVAVYLIIKKQNPFGWIPFKLLHPLVFLLMIVFTYAMMPLMAAINLISMLVSENAVAGMLDAIQVNPLLVNVLLIGAVPALVEEFICRGVFYHSYKEKGPWVGIFMSGLLFGLLHLNLNQFSYALVMGMIFAILVEATGSILAPMMAHFIFNSNSVVLNRILPATAGMEDETFEMADLLLESPEMFLIMLVMLGVFVLIGTAAAVGALLLITRLSGRWEVLTELFSFKRKGENREKGSIIDPYLIAGVTICLLYMCYRLILIWF